MSAHRSSRYAEIAQALTREIQTGLWPLGALLPTESELCQRFEVSRYTAREALRKLASEGLISRRQGSGSVVRATQARVNYNQFVNSIDDLLQYGNATRFKLKTVTPLNADEAIARHLRAQPGARCLCLHGIRLERTTDKLICLTDVYRSLDPNGQTVPTLVDALSQLVRDLDLPRLARVEQEISALALPAAIAAELGLTPGQPGLRILRRYVDGKGRVIAAALSVHPDPSFSYSTVLERARH
jgi:GntR family transcriptional regulator